MSQCIKTVDFVSGAEDCRQIYVFMCHLYIVKHLCMRYYFITYLL